jgi:hypothetical protein
MLKNVTQPNLNYSSLHVKNNINLDNKNEQNRKGEKIIGSSPQSLHPRPADRSCS